MKKPVSVIILGAGGRGFAYANLALKAPKLCKIVGVAEPRDFHREKMVAEQGIAPEMTFRDWKELAKKPRLADAVAICTQDAMHEACVLAFAKLARPMGVRKYVIDPPEPKREDFTEEEYYLKRMHTWKHVKEVFDLGVKDGNIVPVYEICYSGHPSGELKYAYNVKTEGDTGDIEKQKLQEQIMQFKENLLNIKEKKHDELVEEYRKAIEASEYSQLNMAMTAVENDILIALLFKHLPYEFKQKLGLEWNLGRESWRQNKQALDNNRNAIKREFIRVALSDKSVNFAKDLQGMLEGLMDERYGSTKSQINDRVDEKFKKTKDQIRAKIDALKERMKPAKKSEAKEVDEEPTEQPAATPEIEDGKMPTEQAAIETAPAENPEPVEETVDPAETEAPVEPAGAELPESDEPDEGEKQDEDSAVPDAK